MQKDKMQQFTMRITGSNRTELVAIMYDMIDTYLADAVSAREADHHDDFQNQVRYADRVIKELMDILDFKYEIAADLYRLYQFCRKRLAYSLMKYDTTGIEEAKRILTPLGTSFRELAKQDTSGPLMKNTQKVAYGMTYGKSDIAEDPTSDPNRGYFA